MEIPTPPPPPANPSSAAIAAPQHIHVTCQCRNKSSKRWVWYLVLGLLGAMAYFIFLSAIISTVAGTSDRVSEKSYRQYTEVEFPSEERLAIVGVNGGVSQEGTLDFIDSMDYLIENPPASLLIRINCPGGAVTPSDQMWAALKGFCEAHPDVPVVCSFGSVAASGGYYIAMPSDYIFVEPTTITGSIGVIAQVPTFGGMADKIGVETHIVIADGSPAKDDGNDLFTRWYDEDGELTAHGEASRSMMKSLLNNAYDRFAMIVREGRRGHEITRADGTTFVLTDKIISGNPDDPKDTGFCDGSIFVGQEAVDAGVADAVGYIDDAIAYALNAAGLDEETPVALISVNKPSALASMLAPKASTQSIENILTQDIDTRAWLDDMMQARILYRCNIGE